MSQTSGQPRSEATHTGLLITLTIIAALGGLLFGYDSAVISGATDSIKQNFVAPLGLAEGARLSLEGFTIAGALWGCLIGGALGGVMAHYLGRRGGLIVAGVLFFVSSLGSAWPESWLGGLGSVLTPLINALIWFLNLFFEDAPYLTFGDCITNFIGHRLFGGMGIGLASMLAPMYIAEIAPPSKRGSLVTYQQIAIVSGITVSYFVNYFIKKFGGDGDPNWVHTEGWRWMLACCAIPAGIFVLLLFFVPETPRGLMLKGKNEKAREVLTKLANADEAKIVLAEIDASLKETAGKLFSYGGLLLVVGIMLSVFQQLVGINAVLYYGPQMFDNMGFKGDASFASTVIMGIVMVVFTLIATVTVDKWGRKPLLILGAHHHGRVDDCAGLHVQRGLHGPRRPDRGLHLHRGILAVLGPGGVGDARGDLPELHPRQGHGHRRGRAVVHELGGHRDLQHHGRQHGTHGRVQPRLRLLAVRWLQRAGGPVRLEVRPGEQGHVAREHAEALEDQDGLTT